MSRESLEKYVEHIASLTCGSSSQVDIEITPEELVAAAESNGFDFTEDDVIAMSDPHDDWEEEGWRMIRIFEKHHCNLTIQLLCDLER